MKNTKTTDQRQLEYKIEDKRKEIDKETIRYFMQKDDPTHLYKLQDELDNLNWEHKNYEKPTFDDYFRMVKSWFGIK